MIRFIVKGRPCSIQGGWPTPEPRQIINGGAPLLTLFEKWPALLSTSHAPRERKLLTPPAKLDS
jgi:hypothetical protein